MSVRAASTVVFLGAGLFLVGWVIICVMLIMTSEPGVWAGMIGPHLRVLAIVAAVLSPAVILAVLARSGSKGARIGLTVVGVLYVVVGVMTVAGGELLGLPFVIYSLLWLVLLWADPQIRKTAGRHL